MRLLRLLFFIPCRHDLSWPRRGRDDEGNLGFYQVCLKCGGEFEYKGELI